MRKNDNELYVTWTLDNPSQRNEWLTQMQFLTATCYLKSFSSEKPPTFLILNQQKTNLVQSKLKTIYLKHSEKYYHNIFRLYMINRQCG